MQQIAAKLVVAYLLPDLKFCHSFIISENSKVILDTAKVSN